MPETTVLTSKAYGFASDTGMEEMGIQTAWGTTGFRRCGSDPERGDLHPVPLSQGPQLPPRKSGEPCSPFTHVLLRASPRQAPGRPWGAQRQVPWGAGPASRSAAAGEWRGQAGSAGAAGGAQGCGERSGGLLGLGRGGPGGHGRGGSRGRASPGSHGPGRAGGRSPHQGRSGAPGRSVGAQTARRQPLCPPPPPGPRLRAAAGDSPGGALGPRCAGAGRRGSRTPAATGLGLTPQSGSPKHRPGHSGRRRTQPRGSRPHSTCVAAKATQTQSLGHPEPVRATARPSLSQLQTRLTATVTEDPAAKGSPHHLSSYSASYAGNSDETLSEKQENVSHLQL